MKIASSDVQLSSSHASLTRHEVTQTVQAWSRERQERPGDERVTLRPVGDKVSLSNAGDLAAQTAESASDKERINDPKLTLIRSILEMWLGRSVRVFAGMGRTDASGSGITYERHEVYAEAEETRFAANGMVKTADGRAINFQLELSMSRSYYEESLTRISFDSTGKRVDPLVLNFTGNAAELSNQRFAFDLDSDGKMEWINFVAPGSGFLVFDRNQDGVINDGGELFGPSSGDGFAELAALDDDGNGWIDENDAAFGQLQIWIRDADGADRLLSLAEAGIGAISLSRVATPFDIKTSANDLLGQIRSSGVFLHENGMAGTIQQIDLTV